MSQDQALDLTQGPIQKHLMRMTIPMIWGIAAIVSFQLVDMYYIARLGTDYLAAMAFTFPITLFVFYLIMGFGIAMSSVVSRLIGQGLHDDARRVTTHGLVLVSIVGLVLGLGGYLLRDFVFDLMGAKPDLKPLIHQYMTIWFFGVPFLAMPFSGNSAIRASGSAIAPAIIMVGSALLNAALAPVFIFGMFGIPAYGLQGAAGVTVFCQIVSAIAVLYVLGVRKKMLLPLAFMQWPLFGNSAKRLLVIALAAGLTAAIGPFVNSYITSHLSDFGTHVVAAYGVTSRVEAFAFILLMAMSAGMGPIVGQNFGAKKIDRVQSVIRSALMFGAVWCGMIGLILCVFRHPIAALFSQDPEVLHYTEIAFLCLAPSYVFSALLIVWSSCFNAIGHPKLSLNITLLRMIVLTMPLTALGAKLAGATGVFIAISGVTIVCGIGFHLWARRKIATFSV